MGVGRATWDAPPESGDGSSSRAPFFYRGGVAPAHERKKSPRVSLRPFRGRCLRAFRAGASTTHGTTGRLDSVRLCQFFRCLPVDRVRGPGVVSRPLLFTEDAGLSM
ncbi:hypothetical protein MRX96_018931 [Rhipicephalus microplus]